MSQKQAQFTPDSFMGLLNHMQNQMNPIYTPQDTVRTLSKITEDNGTPALSALRSNLTRATMSGGSVRHTAAIGDIKENNYLKDTGIFVNCNRDNCIVNTTMHPRHSVINCVTATPYNGKEFNQAYITGDFNGLISEYQQLVCDPPPFIEGGSPDACLIKYKHGRWSYQVGTFEVDELVTRACQQDYGALFFLNEDRGNSFTPNWQLTPSDQDFIFQGALLRCLKNLGDAAQNWAGRMAWYGNPEFSASVSNGAYVEPMGLYWQLGIYTQWIPADGDGTPVDFPMSDYQDGVGCELLTACNYDFGKKCIDDPSVANNLWQIMIANSQAVDMRATNTGLFNRRYKLFVSSVAWHSLMTHLPCQMVHYPCAGLNIDRSEFLTEANNLMQNKVIDIFGTRYELTQDDYMTWDHQQVTVAGEDGMPDTITHEYCYDMIALPIEVNNQEVLKMYYKDYSRINGMLDVASNFGNTVGEITAGATDGGLFFTGLQRSMTCFNVFALMSFMPVLKTPQLAWSITNIKSCNIKEQVAPDPNKAY